MLAFARDWSYDRHGQSPKFPVFFPDNRELCPESGSQMTTSTATLRPTGFGWQATILIAQGESPEAFMRDYKMNPSEEQVIAVENALKRKHGNKLPYLFIVLFAAVCAGVEMVSPATTYGGQFMRLAFFGWFIWIICRMLETAAKQWKNESAADVNKST